WEVGRDGLQCGIRRSARPTTRHRRCILPPTPPLARCISVTEKRTDDEIVDRKDDPECHRYHRDVSEVVEADVVASEIERNEEGHDECDEETLNDYFRKVAE